MMDDEVKANRVTFSIGGGTYALIGVGVGLAAASWGTPLIWAILSGLFWPAALAYWLMQAIHKLAA